MSFVLALVFPFVVALTFALPTPINSPSTTNIDVPAEQWLIPRMNMHMMSAGTGIPGNPPWPDSMRFNSTIDFDVLVPDHTVNEDGSGRAPLSLNCQASWKNGTLPDAPLTCTGGPSDEVVSFGIKAYTALGERRPELSFVLDMTRAKAGDASASNSLTGSHPITANDPSEPTSYLTCLQGAPYDGLRCTIKSYMSVRTDLVIDATQRLNSENN